MEHTDAGLHEFLIPYGKSRHSQTQRKVSTQQTANVLNEDYRRQHKDRRLPPHTKEGTMDEIFEHLLQDTDRGISINQIVNRIVFPNHDICMQAKAALERDYGEFCFAAVIPDYEDFQHMNPTDATNAALETCGSDGEEVTNVVWGYNSLQYEYNGIPSLEVAKTISKMIGVPVYYEYTDADELAAGAVIADAQGDSVSFANVVDKSCWVYFPEGFDGATDTLFRCGMGTMSMPDGSQKYFEDTTDPIMRSYAQRGNVSLYFDFLKDQFGAQEEPKPTPSRKKSSSAASKRKKKSAETQAQESGNVYMSQAMGAMTFRIVFPNHDCCAYIRDDLDKCFGGFSLQAICGTPDGTFDSPDEVLSTMAGHGIPDDATDVEWGYNSVRYRVAHSVPNAVVLEALVQHYGIPLYGEYFDELKRATGAAITIPNIANPTAFVPGTLGCKEQMYFDRGSDNEGYVALRCGYCQAVSDDGKTRISFVDDPSQSVMAEMAEEASVGVYVRLLKKFNLEQSLPKGYQKPVSRPTASSKKSTSTSSAEKSKISLWMNPIAEKHSWHSIDTYASRMRAERNDWIAFYLDSVYRDGSKMRRLFEEPECLTPFPRAASHTRHAQTLRLAQATGAAESPLLHTLLSEDLLTQSELAAIQHNLEIEGEGKSAIIEDGSPALERSCDSVCYLIMELRNRDRRGGKRFLMWLADTDQTMRVRLYSKEVPAIGEPFICRFSVTETDVITDWNLVTGQKGYSRYKIISEGGEIDVTTMKSDVSAMKALRKANAMFLQACGLKQTNSSRERMTAEQAQRFTVFRELLGRKTGYALTTLFSRRVLSCKEADQVLNIMERASSAKERGTLIDYNDTEVMENKVIYLVNSVAPDGSTCKLYNPNTDTYENYRFQPHLLAGFHSDLPEPGCAINIATSLIESDVIAAWVGYYPGNAQRTARY